MIRNKLKFQKSISIFTDVLTVFVSYILAIYIRYYVMESKPGLNTLSTPYLLIALAYSVIIASILGYVKQSDRIGIVYGMEYGLFAINAVGCLFLLAFLYTIGEQYFSRWALVLFWLISSALLLLKNVSLKLAFNKKQRTLSGKTKVIVIGSGRNCGDYIRAVGYEDSCDFSIVGYIGEKSHVFFDCKFEDRRDGWLGGYSEAGFILKRMMPDEAVFALEDGEMGVLDELFPILKKMGIKACLIPIFGRHIPEHVTVRRVDELKAIDLEEGQEERDSGIYGLGLILSIVFLILMLVIKRFQIGNAGSLGLYEAYRCFIFAIAGYFLFFSLEKVMKDKKYGIILAALFAVLVSVVAIFIYESVYTQGEKMMRDAGYDLKMTLAVIAACWVVKAVVNYISKDDYSILM